MRAASLFLWTFGVLTFVSAAEKEVGPSISSIKKDIFFLAGPECEGRGLQTDGIKKAGDYIAKRFEEMGLKPGNKDSYFQEFKVRGMSKLLAPAKIAVTRDGKTTELDLKQATPSGMSSNTKAQGGLVFVGHGITTDDKKYDDYAGVDVAGKWVIVVRRTPRYGDKDKPFTEADKYAPFVAKLENAEKHKVAGVLLVNDVKSAEKADDLMPFLATASGKSGNFPVFNVKRELIEEWIGKKLAPIEAEIAKELKPQSFEVKGVTLEGETKIERSDILTRNVIGLMPGKGPLAGEYVVVGGHYDHLGKGEFGTLAKGSKDVHFGADDNASGTTGMLELARRLTSDKDYQGRSIIFMGFSGEERGLLGSAHYCKEPIFPIDKTVAMVNLDMIGRLTANKDTGKEPLEIGGVGTAKEFEKLIDKANKPFGFDLKKSNSGFGPSDHSSFYSVKVPVFFFFTGLHPDYHKPTDTPEKINLEGMKRVVDMAETVTREMATVEHKPEYLVTKPERSAGNISGPRLGFMPAEYNEDETRGVPVGAVSDGGPAEKAGLKKDDWIISIGGKPIKNMAGYMAAMGGKKAGQELEVGVRRGEKELKIKVVPE